MKTFMMFIQNADGSSERRPVACRRFSYYIAGVQFWFVLHDALGMPGALDVSEPKSGKRVCRVEHASRGACLGDDKAAAKMALDNLVKQHGAARVRSVLAGVGV